MIKILLSLLLFTSQSFAGLPPNTVRGQSQTAKPTVFNIQAPYNQATTTAAVTALIETGYENLLLNPNYEALVSTTSWTAGSGVTASVDTTNVNSGKQAVSLALSSTNGLVWSQDVTPTIKMSGQNMEYGFWLLNTAIITLQVCSRQAGATVGTCQAVGTSADYQYVPVNYPGPAAGSIGVSLFTTGSTTGTVVVDNAYVGKARNIGTVAQASYWGGINLTANGAGTCSFAESTSTGNGDFKDLTGASGCAAWTTKSPGNVTAVATNSSSFAVVGDGEFQVKAKGGFTNGNPSAICNWQLTDGTNNYQPQFSYSGASGSSVVPYLEFHVSKGSSASVTYKIQAAGGSGGTCQIDNTTAGRNFAIDVYRFPSQSQQAVQMRQSNYDWRPYTPTFTGFGVVTGIECQEKRNGSDNLIRCKFTSGTTTATEARVSLPNSNISADTSRIGSLQVAGFWGLDMTSTTRGKPILMEPSVGYVTFGLHVTTTPELLKQNGNSMISSGTKLSFMASVPIQGWIENQNAPLLVGGVTSSSLGLERVERALVQSVCSASPCTITSQSGSWISSITRASTGMYTVNIASGIFSATPTCTVSNNQNALVITNLYSVSSTSFNIVSFTSSNGVVGDTGMNIICQGPR